MSEELFDGFEAGELSMASEVLWVLEPLLREAKEDRNDAENDLVMVCYYDGLIEAYKTAIALLNEVFEGEQKCQTKPFTGTKALKQALVLSVSV